jgi:hypothetical protein
MLDLMSEAFAREELLLTLTDARPLPPLNFDSNWNGNSTKSWLRNSMVMDGVREMIGFRTASPVARKLSVAATIDSASSGRGEAVAVSARISHPSTWLMMVSVRAVYATGADGRSRAAG